jgi:hypothetical protein
MTRNSPNCSSRRHARSARMKRNRAADELLGRLAKMPPQPQSGSKTKRRT